MAKYQKELVLKKARITHFCLNCNEKIQRNDLYYCEETKNKFLQSLNSKKFCNGCFIKEGNDLLNKIYKIFKIEDKNESLLNFKD